MYYFVTYAAIDAEYGNPLWHSFILLSRAEENKKTEVVDVWGFYGLPTTERKTCLGKIKLKLRVDVDFVGNHGMLRHEDLRYLDKGKALHGVTFEVTEEKFYELQKKCQNMAKEQNDAILEAANALNLQENEKYRIYSHEKFSKIIFEWEKNKAREEKREPRLKPFEFRLKISSMRLTTRYSYTCKSQIISILQGILSDTQINRITNDGNHPTLPILSGKMERLFLHSSGPLREYKSERSNKISYYRDLKDAGVKIHWTFPPQEVEYLDTTLNTLKKLNPSITDESHELVHKLQNLEWSIIQAKCETDDLSHKNNLIKSIVDCYEKFAIMYPKSHITAKNSGWDFVSSFFPLKDPAEITLSECIAAAKSLMNDLYMATTHHWTLDEDTPEAFVSSLSTNDKKALCQILGRSYVEPELVDSETEDEMVKLLM